MFRGFSKALKGQADQFEPWAANKLGLFYLTGTVKSRKTQETLTFDRIDRNLSYEYFEKAVQYYFDSNSGWAYANMIVNFPKKYIADEDYSKLKSHLEKLVKIHNEEAINYVRDNFKGVYGVFEDNKTCDELLRIINK